MKIIVVGANHAGTHALLNLCGKGHEVIAYDQNDNISFLGCGIALWVSDVVKDPKDLFYASPEELEKSGVDIKTRHQVTSVDYENKLVHVMDLETGVEFSNNYDKLIIATGSWPIMPNIKGVELENVQIIKLFQHGEELIKKVKTAEIKNITVVGGGYIGVEIAESLAHLNKEVNLVNDCNVINSYYDIIYQTAMSKKLREIGVDVYECVKLVSINGDTKVESVTTTFGEIETDMVIVAVGFHPLTESVMSEDLKVDSRGAIIVNAQMETSIKDVYAVGDCASIISGITESNLNIALASNAVRTGIVAAKNILGEVTKLPPVQGSNAISIGGLNLCATGFSYETCRALNMNVDSVTITETAKPKFMEDNYEVTTTLVWEKDTKRIVGFQIMAQSDISLIVHMFSLAIQKKCTIEEIMLLDTFFLPHFNNPHNFVMMLGQAAVDKSNV